MFDERGKIIEPVGIRHELVVLHVLGDFLIAAVEKTDVRHRLDDDFAVELKHEPQHAMGRRVRRAHVEHHLFPNVAI